MKARFWKRGPLLILGAAIIVTTAHALIDADTDGMSDVWEEQYGFPTSGAQPSHQLPGADPDSDGWTNLEESQAGTDPNSGIPPLGIIRPTVLQHPEFSTVFTINWPSLEGKQYKLYASPDLSAGSWIQIDTPMMGTGANIEFGMEVLDNEGFIPDKLFWKVLIADVDSDGDTLTDYEELAKNLDPYHTDTDLDGYPDGTDPDPGPGPGSSATLNDPDNTRPPTGIATNLRAFWDFESQVGTSLPAVFPDRSGNGRTATSSFDGPTLPGMPSKSANVGIRSVTAAGTILQNQASWSISGWVRLGEGNISTSPVDGQGLGNYRIIYAHYDQQGTSPLNQPLGKGNVLAIRKAPAGEMWMVGGYEQTTYFNEPPNINGNPKTVYAGNTFTLPAGTTDDGEWHHFAVTRTTGGFGYKVYLDGDQVASLVVSEYTGLAYDVDTRLTLGRLYPAHFPTAFPEAFIDRVRVHGRVLNPTEVGNLYRQDIDNDGLWDITECKTALWRDLNDNLVKEVSEFAYSVSPFRWQPPDYDSDGDGIPDSIEQASTTKIGVADSDGDGIPDGWETANGLNPNNATDAGLDNDVGGADGLTNLQEYLWNTDPKKRDTDGDGTNDGPEISAAGNPNDASDGGSVPPEERFSMTLGIGDKSGSKSETYYMHCYWLDPSTGQEKRVYTLRPTPTSNDIYKSEVQSFFRKGHTYTFQIDWQTTTNTGKSTSPTEGPDFDYTFIVTPGSNAGGDIVDGWNLVQNEAGPALLNQNANDVANDEPTFRRLYEAFRVIFSPFEFEVIHKEIDPATGEPVDPGAGNILRDEIVEIRMKKLPNNNQNRTITLAVLPEAMRIEDLPDRGEVKMYDFGSINIGGAVKPDQTEFTLKATEAGQTRIKAVFNKAGKLRIGVTSTDGQINYTSREYTIQERIRKYAIPYPGFKNFNPNQHDEDFLDAVTDWGAFYSLPIDTVDRIKAMAVAESNVGAKVQAPATRPNDILTIGHPDDNVLESIQGSINQWDLDLAHPKRPAADHRYKKLNYQTAGIGTTREAIYWGVLWFYVKGFAFPDNIEANPAFEFAKRNQPPLDIIDGIEEPEFQFKQWSPFELMTLRYNGNPNIDYMDRVNKALQSGLHFNAAIGNDKLWPIRSDKSARP